MTKFNRQHKKQMLKESSILLEYNRVKSRTKPGDKALWESIEKMYDGVALNEERLLEQAAMFKWLSSLGDNALSSIKSYIGKADEKTKKLASDLAQKANSKPVGRQIKNLLKNGNWKEAFIQAGNWITGETTKPAELQEISLQSIGDWWRNNPVKRTVLTLAFLVLMFTQASPGEKISQDQVDTTGQTEYVLDGEPVDDINAADDIFDNNTQSPNDLKFGNQSIENAGFETGVSFELGSSNLDAQGQKQIDDIANDYLDKIVAAQTNGDIVQSLDIDVQGGASNTGDNWDVDKDYDGSLTQNRESEAANELESSITRLAQQRGVDLSGIDINYNLAGGMDAGDLGSSENVGDGQKTATQNTLINGVLTHQPPAQDAPTDGGVDVDFRNPGDMAKFNTGEPTGNTDKTKYDPGTSRGSRNLELRDLLYLGGIDPIPVTFGDYKSDAEMGRVDWRDVEAGGDKFLQDQKKMAIWITNTRKSKFPLIKRAQNALQGIIDIEFDADKKYKGNVGKKYEPSTTTALTEQPGQLPPEVNKRPEIPAKIKSLQNNTTAMWKYILGNNSIGDIIDSKVAQQFDGKMKEFLEQLELMYGKTGTRGNVGFNYRRNPNYEGSKYTNIPKEWSEKRNVQKQTPTQQGQEVLPFVQSYTGDFVQGIDGTPLVGSASEKDLQEEIKRIKKLLL